MTIETLHAPRAPGSAVPFQQVLLLCVPALIVGLVLRIEFLVTIPEAFYAADSRSYFEAAWQLWTNGAIVLNAKRRFLYPIVLMFTPPLPGSPAVSVAVLQHLLGLVIIVGIGWIVAQMTRFPNVWVPLATCVAAIWPRMFWYEHEMVAEVWLLAAFVAAVALALPCGSLKDPRRLFWFLVAATAILATKPHGRPMWFGLMIACVAMAGNPLKWGKKNLAMLALAVAIIFTSGSGEQGSWLFLNSTLPFVQTEGEPYSEYRAILKPFVEEARSDLENYPDKQVLYKKGLGGQNAMMGDKWLELWKDRKLYRKVAIRLALEGVVAHPVAYAQLVFRKIARAADGMRQRRISPAAFWRDQERLNAKRLTQPNNQLELVYGMNTDAYLRLVEERRQRTTWLEPLMEKIGSHLSWTQYRDRGPGQAPEITLTLVGWLLALGLAACLSPRYLVCRALLWLPLAFYLFMVFGVGDGLRRYLQPVEWVGLVLIAIGLDTVATLLANEIARLRRKQPHRPAPS